MPGCVKSPRAGLVLGGFAQTGFARFSRKAHNPFLIASIGKLSTPVGRCCCGPAVVAGWVAPAQAIGDVIARGRFLPLPEPAKCAGYGF